MRGKLKNEELEKKFQSNALLSKKYQYYYIKDPTPDALADMDEIFGSPVLFLGSNDVTPTTSPLLLSLISLASLFLIVIFCLGTFANNDNVTQRLAEMNAIDFNDDLLNNLLIPLLCGVVFSQVLHEFGHYVVSKQNNFKMSAPTILPSIYIPYLGK